MGDRARRNIMLNIKRRNSGALSYIRFLRLPRFLRPPVVLISTASKISPISTPPNHNTHPPHTTHHPTPALPRPYRRRPHLTSTRTHPPTPHTARAIHNSKMTSASAIFYIRNLPDAIGFPKMSRIDNYANLPYLCGPHNVDTVPKIPKAPSLRTISMVPSSSGPLCASAF